MPILKLTIQGEADLGQIKSEAKKIEKTINKARSQTSSSSSSRASQIDKETDRLRELRKELRRKISLVDADLRLGNKSQKEAEESIRQIKQWAEAQEAFNREHLVGAQNLKTFANAQTRAQTGFKGMSAVTNRANQVLFDLNQGLQDLPFGMRGIGNNIPFVIEGFRRFGKAAKEQGVSPLRTFGRALTSPAGLIGTAAAVIPTLILFADQFDLFGSSASKAKEQVSGVVSNLTSLQNKINDLRGIDSLFNIEEDLETVRTLAVFEEDIRDKQREILDDAAFRGTWAEAIAPGRDKTLLSTEQLDEFNRLQELLEQTEKQRLDLETKIRVAKDAQATQTVKNRKEQQEALKILKENLETRKRSAEFHRFVLDLRREEAKAAKEAARARKEELENIRQLQQELLANPPASGFGAVGDESSAIQTVRKLNQQFELAQVSGFQKKRLQILQKFQNQRIQLYEQGLATRENLRKLDFIQHKQIQQLKLQATQGALQMGLRALRTAFSESKGIAIAQAVVDAAVAVQKALASAPPPWNFIAAGSVAAATAKQIHTILNAEPGQGAQIDQQFQGTPIRLSAASRLPEFQGGGLRRTSHRGIDRVTGQPVVINVTQKSDAMGLAFEVRNGEAKIRSQQHSG